MVSRLFAYSQYLLPKYWLTAVVYRLARVRVAAVKDALIRGFVKLYGIRLDEVSGRVPGDFSTLNDFFVRELKDGARPIDPDPKVIVSPADGKLRNSVSVPLSGSTQQRDVRAPPS